MTRLLRLPADVLNIIARSLSAKELGRCSRTSRAFANAAQSGFEEITRLHAPGLALLVKPLSPGFIDWRVLCCKALRLNHRTRLKPVVNLDSAVEQANKNFHFTLETFDGDPSDPATKILSAQRAYLCAAANDRGDVEVSVEAELPNTFQRNRVAFICVYAARASKLYETAVLYSGKSTREMSRSGRAWWFAQRPAPWNDLCAAPGEKNPMLLQLQPHHLQLQRHQRHQLQLQRRQLQMVCFSTQNTSTSRSINGTCPT